VLEISDVIPPYVIHLDLPKDKPILLKQSAEIPGPVQLYLESELTVRV
jgi:hypothetical protein